MQSADVPRIALIGDACCGCGACAAACPKACIAMEEDQFGFLRPVLHSSECVSCKRCESVCPVLAETCTDGCESVAWAQVRDADILKRSSSGGVFGLLARDIASRGGVICGAVWDEDFKGVKHVLIRDEDRLDAAMRSKYVQSVVGTEVYKGIRSALLEGRPVLYSGTACQVAGMRSYLGKLADSELFLSVDVICHGTPSPKLWREWIDYLTGGGQVDEVNFRSKSNGWASYRVLYSYRNQQGDGPQTREYEFRDDWYMRAFLSNASLRPSCHTCPAKRSSGSDITLGDFWGIDKVHPGENDDRGMSAICCNTERGVEAFGRISHLFRFGASSLESVRSGNPSLTQSVSPHPQKDTFMRALAEDMPIKKMSHRWPFRDAFVVRIGKKVLSSARRIAAAKKV